MTIFFIFLNIFLASVFSKYCFIIIFELKNKFKTRHNLYSFLLIPFIYIFEKNFNKDFFKSELKKVFVMELFTLIIALVYSLGFLIYIQNNIISEFSAVATYVYFGIIVFTFIYLSLYDIVNYSIQIDIVRTLFIFTIFINIFSFIARNAFNSSFNTLNAGDFSNLLGFGIGFTIIFLLVYVSKEKAMGEGDIETSALIGLIMGAQGFILSFLLTVFIGSFIGIIYAIIKKQLKGLIIPFVPLQTLGLTFAILIHIFLEFRVFEYFVF